MSFIKRKLENNERKQAMAIEIAIEAEVLERCEHHEDCVIKGGQDIEAAYKLGNARFTAGKLEDIFESEEDVTDTIKKVVSDDVPLECPSCANWLDKG